MTEQGVEEAFRFPQSFLHELGREINPQHWKFVESWNMCLRRKNR